MTDACCIHSGASTAVATWLAPRPGCMRAAAAAPHTRVLPGMPTHHGTLLQTELHKCARDNYM